MFSSNHEIEEKPVSDDLFSSLESYFSHQENETSAQHLYETYLRAKESKTDENYRVLIEELYSSDLIFPDFIVECHPGFLGQRYEVCFRKKREVTDSVTKKSPSRKEKKSASNSLAAIHESYYKYIQAIRKEILTERTLREELEHQLRDLNAETNETILDCNEEVRYERCKQLSSSDTRDKEYEETMKIPPIQDTFTCIMIDPTSRAAFYGWFIFCLQLTMFTLFVIVDVENQQNGTVPLVPKGVDGPVHGGQIIAILLTGIVQEGFWDGLLHLVNGFDDHLEDQGVTFHWWVLTNIMRTIEGLYAVAVTFILIINSDNNIDLFKEFTAMTFISSFDNILFQLAHMNVLGFHMKRSADKVEALEIHRNLKRFPLENSQKRVSRYLFYLIRPLACVTYLVIIMYVIWFNKCFYPQITGSLLCQKVHFQFDDAIEPSLSYFSGTFEYQRANNWFKYSTVYEEFKGSSRYGERTPLRLETFGGAKWIFSLNGELIVESGAVKDQALFDIMEVGNDWSVGENLGGIPISVEMTCIDGNSEDDEEECNEVLVDERYPVFISTREWSRSFAQLENVQVYGKNLYWALAHDKTNFDLIFFTGIRWIVLSSATLSDLSVIKRPLNVTNRIQEIGEHLQNTFHGYWSNYSSDFFSEKILMETPEDSSNPLGVLWYSAMTKFSTWREKTETTVNEKKAVSQVLICRFCSSTKRPCFCDNECSSDTETCHCTNGANGTLCQIEPTSNGQCDPYFNTIEYGYDGGDCCRKTCRNQDSSLCGFNNTMDPWYAYVGFDMCQRSSGWEKSSYTDNELSSLQVASISENSRRIAALDESNGNIKVYHIAGTELRNKMTVHLEGFDQVSEIQVSSFTNINPTIFDDFDPLTIAVRNSHNVQIHDYERKPTGWRSHHPYTDTISPIKKIGLKKNGNLLGVSFENKTMVLFERTHYTLNLTKTDTFSNIENFFLSSNGNQLILLKSDKAEVFNLRNKRKIQTINFPDKVDVEKTTVSPNGNHILLIMEISGKLSKYRFYGTEQNFTLESHEKRVQYFVDDIFYIHNSGNITIHSKRDGTLRQLETSSDEGPIERGALSIQFADDETFFLAIVDELSGSGFKGVQFWHKHLPTAKGTSTLRLSFALEKPQEFRWNLFRFNANKTTLLKAGGPYESSYMNYDESISVPTDSCIGITIYDLGLDGLNVKSRNTIGQPEGFVFVSENSKIIWMTNSTNGFLNVFKVKSHESCKNDFENYINTYGSTGPYEETLHDTCLTNICKWEVSGVLERGSIPKKSDDTGVPISISADGLVVAVSNYIQNNVVIYRYDNITTRWIEYGEPLSGHSTDQFGYSISLSANGRNIAIASPKAYNESEAWSGQVKVYVYSGERWIRRLGTLNEQNRSELVGEYSSVSISADGNVLAVGTRLNGARNDSVCLAKAYRYRNSKWTQYGRCLSYNTYGALKVMLAASGSVVAMNNVYQPSRNRYFGEVTVLAYSEYEEKWIQRNTSSSENGSFQGVQDSHFLGISTSMSSDGNVIALGGSINVPSGVYNYNYTTQNWDQRGQAISPLLEGAYYAVSLSASGTVLVMAQVNTTRVFIFDHEANEWILSDSKIRHGADIFNVNPSEWAVVASSADTTTIVNVFETEKVQIMRLVQENEKDCINDTALFEFTIQPDMFPKDIVWSLENQKGSKILGGKRLSDYEKQTFSACLATADDALYTFNIIDVIKDGVCCSNGDGNFNLTWNAKKTFGANDGIKKFHRGTVCLPFETNSEIYQSDDKQFFYVSSNSSSLFSLNFYKPGDDVTWSIFKSDGLLLSTGSASDQNVVRRCIPADECLIFRVHSWTGNGTKFSIDGQMIHGNNGSNKFFFNGKRIGNCSSNQKGQRPLVFGFDLGTDLAGRFETSSSYFKVFASDLIDEPFFENGVKVEESVNQLYHGSKNVTYNGKDCLYVRLFDVPGRAKKQYGAWLNDNLLKQGNHDGLLTTFHNGTECTTNQCPSNQSHFSLDFLTGDDASQFNWKLLLGSDVISKSTQQYLKNKYYFYQQCLTVPPDGCVTLKLNDTTKIPQTYFAVMWNGSLVKENQQISNEDEIKLGNCNESARCDSNQSLFSIIFRFDGTSENTLSQTVRWRLKKSDESTLKEGKNYDENMKSISDEKCIHATSGDCLYLDVEVKTYDLNWKLSLSLDGNLVKSHTLYQPRERIYFGNCQQRN